MSQQVPHAELVDEVASLSSAGSIRSERSASVRSSRRSSRRRSSVDERKDTKSDRKSKRGSILSDMVDAVIVTGDDRHKKELKGKPAAVVALYIHFSICSSIVGLVMGINLLSILLTSHKFPWSLYVLVTWSGMLTLHFAVTWSIMKGRGEDTHEMDVILRTMRDFVTWCVQQSIEFFTNGFNPFPENSRLARLYDYLMVGVEPSDFDYDY